MSEEIGGKIFKVTQVEIKRHERVLIKQLVLISSEVELMQGELDKFPRRVVQVPEYETPDRVKDESSLAYRMIRTDPLGEQKISPVGNLMNGRSFLIDTFSLANLPHRFVLISNLMNTLQYEGTQDDFLNQHPQLLPLTLEEKDLSYLKNDGLINDTESDKLYVTARSAFVLFGAALIVSGLRVVDDYWETIAKEQGFTPHHRVFKLSNRLYNVFLSLKPSVRHHTDFEDSKNDAYANTLQDEGKPTFESPYLTVSEQASFEIRQEYGREFSNGEHIGVVVPSQSINGALEISSQFKVPKYHNKNSFQHATQLNTMDIPIGLPSQDFAHLTMQQSSHSHISQTEQLENNLTGTSISPPHSHSSVSRVGKRILNSILDTGSTTMVGKSKKSEENELITLPTDYIQTNEQLNINGWKFESLPLRTEAEKDAKQFSSSGLPLYEKERLIKRLKLLTPNEIRELEHLHDSLFLNTGLQNVRKLRENKWTKYWQYKTGIPVGLRKADIRMFEKQYLKTVLEQTTSVTNYNEATNADEVSITRRIPNVNFLGYSNIRGFKPPYANAPNNTKS